MDVEKNIPESTLQEALKTSYELAQREGVRAAVEYLMPLEKQSRLGGDAASNIQIVLQMVNLCLQKGDFKELESLLTTLSKKRGLVKAAITDAVKRCIDWLQMSASSVSAVDRDRLIEIIRNVTEGKIYLEIERARITRMLAHDLEATNKLTEAAHVMQEVPVETFGSLEKRERVEFILEQMRLSVAIGEYQRATLISRKVSGTKTFENASFEDLKIRYLELMVALALHDRRYADCWRHYRELYFYCPSINRPPADAVLEERSLKALKLCCIFALLAPASAVFNHSKDHGQGGCQAGVKDSNEALEQRLGILMKEKRLTEHLLIYADLLRTFLTEELVRWPVVEKIFGPELRSSFPDLFATTNEHWQHFSDRVVEHNVRIIARTYQSIRIGRLAELLERTLAEAEEKLCSLIIDRRMLGGTSIPRIDRVTGIVTFQPPLHPDALLNEWSSQVDSLLTLVVKTNYQIAKEEMMHMRTTL